MSFVVPGACTLPTVDRLAGLEATVRDLTAREAGCCSFFTVSAGPTS